MKAATPALISFMENATTFASVDLYTFTLNGGAVLRYSGGDTPVAFGGVTWSLGPPIWDGGVTSGLGPSPSTVDITILGGNSKFLVNGLDVLDFIDNFGLEGATVRIDRAIAASTAAIIRPGPVGIYNRFTGRFAEAKELGQTQAVVTLTDWRDVLQTTYPADVYQTSCLNVFSDSKCGVNVAALAVHGTAGNGSVASTSSSFGSSLGKADGYFSLGVCTFTSGANAGLSRSVKTYNGAYGMVILSSPLAAPPAFGDAFTITPGCALSMAACTGFANLPNFRGAPYIPAPTTGLPS